MFANGDVNLDLQSGLKLKKADMVKAFHMQRYFTELCMSARTIRRLFFFKHYCWHKFKIGKDYNVL